MKRSFAHAFLILAVLFGLYADATRRDDAADVQQAQAVQAERAAYADQALGIVRLAAK